MGETMPSPHHDEPSLEAQGTKAVPDTNEPAFVDSITLDEPMSPQEAVAKLAAFHGVSNEAILNAFFHLRNFEQGTVTFKRSVNHSIPTIAMQGSTPDGKQAWSGHINRHTGQPMQTAG